MISKELGIKVIDADLISRQVVEPGQPAYKKIVKTFGIGILQEDQQQSIPSSSSSSSSTRTRKGQINREKLGALIFKNESARKRLNSITHPYIRIELLKQVISIMGTSTQSSYVE